MVLTKAPLPDAGPTPYARFGAAAARTASRCLDPGWHSAPGALARRARDHQPSGLATCCPLSRGRRAMAETSPGTISARATASHIVHRTLPGTAIRVEQKEHGFSL